MSATAAAIASESDGEPEGYLLMRNRLIANRFGPESSQTLLNKINNLKCDRGKGADFVREMYANMSGLECARACENGVITSQAEPRAKFKVTHGILELPKVHLGDHEKVQILHASVRQSPQFGSQIATCLSLSPGKDNYVDLSKYISTLDGYMTNATTSAN
jgi:hypothetical protein